MSLNVTLGMTTYTTERDEKLIIEDFRTFRRIQRRHRSGKVPEDIEAETILIAEDDLNKLNRGYWVYQHYGTTYTLEDNDKIMIECSKH